MTQHVPLSKIDRLLDLQAGQTWSVCGGNSTGQEYEERLQGEDGLYHLTGKKTFLTFKAMTDGAIETGRVVDTGTRFLGDDYGLFIGEQL